MANRFKDYFSRQADEYARRRPTYPPSLFEYLAAIAPSRRFAWDCGTGNGQAAIGLSAHFERVVATDPSPDQLRNAFPHPRVEYRQATAEDADLEAGSVDLITVAQALHWFDLDRFYARARFVLKPQGVIAVWAYSLCRITPDLDRLINHFYYDIVGPYWPKERRYVDEQYRTLPFPFPELTVPAFEIELEWDLEALLGYLRTWSPTRRYMEANGTDPVEMIEGELGQAWGAREDVRRVTCPIHLRVGRMMA